MPKNSKRQILCKKYSSTYKKNVYGNIYGNNNSTKLNKNNYYY